MRCETSNGTDKTIKTNLCIIRRAAQIHLHIRHTDLDRRQSNRCTIYRNRDI